MLTAILVAALLGQCPGGSCAVSQPAYALPQYYYAPQAPAQLWQLADRTGQVWQHTDPAYLRAWIAHHNGLQLSAPVGGK